MKKGFSLCGKTSQGNPCSGPVLSLYGIAVRKMSFYTNYLLWLSLCLQILRFKNCFQTNFKDVCIHEHFCLILKLDSENNLDINLPNSLYLSRTWPLYGGVAEKQPMRGGRKTTSKTDVV